MRPSLAGSLLTGHCHINARRGEFFEYLHRLSGWDIPVWIRFTAGRSVLDVGGLVGHFVVDISLPTCPSLLPALAAMMRYSAEYLHKKIKGGAQFESRTEPYRVGISEEMEI